MNRYLLGKNQISITPTINRISKSFKSEGLFLVMDILKWIHTNLKFNNDNIYKSKVFRKRTADQIIRSRLVTGCTDYALVFIALARAKGIPTKYVETISKEWIKKPDINDIKGHVFAEVYMNKKWYIIDPEAGAIRHSYGKKYKLVEKGLDSWDVGIKDINTLRLKFKKFTRSKIIY